MNRIAEIDHDHTNEPRTKKKTYCFPLNPGCLRGIPTMGYFVNPILPRGVYNPFVKPEGTTRGPFSGRSNHLPLTTSSVADSPPDLAIGDHLHHRFHSAHSFSFWTLRGVKVLCYQSIYQIILSNARMYKTQHKSLDKKLPPPINW